MTDTHQERWRRIQTSLQHGGALRHLRNMAHALSTIQPTDELGPRAFALVGWHLWGEIGRVLDDLATLANCGDLHPRKGDGFEVRR